jgi:hypothetical protein
MAKYLKDILKQAHNTIKGVRPSETGPLSTGKDPGVDYKPKAGDEADFIAKHSVQKWDDIAGNPNFADKVGYTLDKEKHHGNTEAKAKAANEEVQIDELSTDLLHRAAHKAAKRAMGDAQGRSGPIFKKYAGMANKFRDKGMSQEKKEKAAKSVKEEIVDEAYGSGAGKTATGTKWSDNSVSVSVHHDGKKHTFTGKHDYVAKKLKAAHGIDMHQVNFKKASDMKEETLDEISPATKKAYVAAATDDKKHAERQANHSEYTAELILVAKLNG